jgi:site-specific DNA recombinase
MNTYIPAGIYARISKDELGDHLAVTRQIKDDQQLCDRLGWTVVDIYKDDNVSATRKNSVRKEYERAMADIRSGKLKALAVWDVDRLTRTPRELEDIIDLANEYGLLLGSVGGDIDLGTPQGRMMARMKGTIARHETDQSSRRIKRKFDENAVAGKPHGPAAFGWRREQVLDDSGKIVGSRDVLYPLEADFLRDAAAMLLGGTSLRSVTAEMNRRIPRSPVWTSNRLRQFMLRARNAGLRVHREKIVGNGDWPAIYQDSDGQPDVDTHDRVVALLTDPRRVTNLGATRKHLLTGLLTCGVCGSTKLIANIRKTTRTDGKPLSPIGYCCRACGKIRRKQSSVDAMVEEVMIGILSRPDALDALASGEPERATKAREARDAAVARKTTAAERFAHGAWDADQVDLINSVADVQIREAQAIIDASMPALLPSGMTGPDADVKWAAASLDEKRTLIRALIKVTLLPSTTHGRVFDRDSVLIEPR